MRLLYVASGIPVPGTLGGSTHVAEVARGLARRGHEVHVVAASCEGWAGLAPFARPISSFGDGYHLHQQDVPKSVALLGAWPIVRLARTLRPDAIIERYYNFAGAGVLAARLLGIPVLLEVNALIVDPPAVFKRRLDDMLGRLVGLGRQRPGPMRRWAALQCQWAARIVTPLPTTVPPEIPRQKIVALPWGADVERFEQGPGTGDRGLGTGDRETGDRGPGTGDRGSAPNPQSPIPNPQSPTAVFLGSFRPWHGVIDFVQAAALLVAAGKEYRFLLVGDGPERARAEELAGAWPGRFVFTGSVPHEQVPALLAEASVGVAPFNTAAHPALREAGFFWSPLKVYEYMAAGLPVVTPDLPPLNEIVGHGREGLLYPEGDLPALAATIARLLDDPALAQQLGASARTRVVTHYSWQKHCEELEHILQTMQKAKGKRQNGD